VEIQLAAMLASTLHLNDLGLILLSSFLLSFLVLLATRNGRGVLLFSLRASNTRRLLTLAQKVRLMINELCLAIKVS